MDIKRIKFERTGGFAGMRIATDFELDDLPEEQAHQLIELLDEVDFDELPKHQRSENQMVNGFTYSITLDYQKTFTIGEDSAPEEMQPLFELLYRIARQQARKQN